MSPVGSSTAWGTLRGEVFLQDRHESGWPLDCPPGWFGQLSPPEVFGRPPPPPHGRGPDTPGCLPRRIPAPPTPVAPHAHFPRIGAAAGFAPPQLSTAPRVGFVSTHPSAAAGSWCEGIRSAPGGIGAAAAGCQNLAHQGGRRAGKSSPL